MSTKEAILSAICSKIREKHDLKFNIIEVGARPIEAGGEEFYSLVELFPGSKINLFEPDDELCKELNESAAEGMVYHPYALGKENESRTFYNANHPMCSSLYKPNDLYIKYYNALEVSALKSEEEIYTHKLDDFLKEHNVGEIDFIKIDVQGAELDIFQGGKEALEHLVAIVSEVEFVPLYENQPLFGDVCQYLTGEGMMFHKFLGLAGRTMKPITIQNNPNIATQHMWSDAVFMKDVSRPDLFSDDQLLKLAVMSYIYNSPDVTYNCLYVYDLKHGTELHKSVLG